MSNSPKQWWKFSSQLMLKATSTNSIPPLKNPNGSWAMTSTSKANVLASTFAEKCFIPPSVQNEYSPIDPKSDEQQSGFLPIRRRIIKQVLNKLELESSNGLDLVATRILKKFASEFALPVALMCRNILRDGVWLTRWKVHWVMPLHRTK